MSLKVKFAKFYSLRVISILKRFTKKKYS